MTNEEKAALQAVFNDAGRPAEERNEAGRALGELPPLDQAPADQAGQGAQAPADQAGQGAE